MHIELEPTDMQTFIEQRFFENVFAIYVKKENKKGKMLVPKIEWVESLTDPEPLLILNQREATELLRRVNNSGIYNPEKTDPTGQGHHLEDMRTLTFRLLDSVLASPVVQFDDRTDKIYFQSMVKDFLNKEK